MLLKKETKLAVPTAKRKLMQFLILSKIKHMLNQVIIRGFIVHPVGN